MIVKSGLNNYLYFLLNRLQNSLEEFYKTVKWLVIGLSFNILTYIQVIGNSFPTYSSKIMIIARAQTYLDNIYGQFNKQI